ncbi:cell division regulator GpsB [Halalkalibacterium halodurans]|uniref:Cell cycle adapter protein GpsB n=2 Tax=Halalkalibacterium halodurans TaxID=86665 RepID=GPSB_HALH5|nr:cell division regulator GpsB [Halalkalibacterium halodurans]Q9KC05.1 RecName: Full=Cell cycle protein GpsB; AltName: Full=Guiding PBP1-shuttling protein [Halalkalibacterium halodurans C-125]MDY7222329.1 cell division regulator GpsB [Halalkalibacterium halodurans]MDY7241550.1 cell division regulator GpsB [Halalkalibacterium halodurans]MED3647700.1 cell division regulator GpsB [Halalkalibacterium halodurans]MED4082364.1 cell division regulator GpsB [Halalkalibacterium halodurans]MED4083485.1
MYNQEVKLTTKEILEKEFKTSMRGYSQDEVDKFLDVVIQDYEVFQKKIERLEQEIHQLRTEAKRAASERQTRHQTSPSVGSTNYDILQRLSNLEKKVFGNKLYE